jgi:hypothetical protein
VRSNVFPISSPLRPSSSEKSVLIDICDDEVCDSAGSQYLEIEDPKYVQVVARRRRHNIETIEEVAICPLDSEWSRNCSEGVLVKTILEVCFALFCSIDYIFN